MSGKNLKALFLRRQKEIAKWNEELLEVLNEYVIPTVLEFYATYTKHTDFANYITEWSSIALWTGDNVDEDLVLMTASVQPSEAVDPFPMPFAIPLRLCQGASPSELYAYLEQEHKKVREAYNDQVLDEIYDESTLEDMILQSEVSDAVSTSIESSLDGFDLDGLDEDVIDRLKQTLGKSDIQ